MREDIDPIDQFLREQVDKARFSMKEEYWEKMSGLLDVEEKKKKRFFPYWRGLSVLLLLLATGVGALLTTRYITKRSHAKTERVQPQAVAETLTPDSVIRINSADLAGNPTSVTQPSQESPTDVSPNSAPANQTPKASVQNVTPSVTPSSNVASSDINTDQANATPSNGQLSVAASTKPLKQSVSKGKESNPARNKKNPNKNPKHKLISDANPVLQTGKSTTPKQKNVDPVQTQPEAVVSATSTMPKPNPVRDNSTDRISVNGKPYEAQATVVHSKPKPIDPSISNPRYNPALKDYVPQHSDSFITTIYKPVKEKIEAMAAPTSSPAKPTINDSSIKAAYQKQHLIWIAQFGINLNKGLRGNIENELKLGVSPYVGLGFQKGLRKGLGITASLGFTYFNGLNMVKKDQLYSYSFGVDSIETNLYTKKLYQLYLPVSVYYDINSGNQFFAGMGITYSFQTSGKLAESTNYAQPNSLSAPSSNKSTTNTTYVTSVNKGFQTIDFFLQAGYSYRLKQNLWAQAMFQQGFMDISKNNYYNHNVNNTLTRLSVGLKYNFNRNERK